MNPWEKADSWLRPTRFALALAALVILQFPAVVLGLETFFFRDYGFFGYPLAAHHRAAFWQGEIPLWNPYNNAGLPFLAQWNTMLLYPGSLIYLLLPLPWSLPIFCLFHQFLAGLGMYFLARSSAKSNLAGAVAGVAFAFGGLLLSSLKWPNNTAAFGLMPWVVWTCLRALPQVNFRSIGFAALTGAIQMLSGAPEVILLTWLIVGSLAIAEAISRRCPGPILSLAAIVALVSFLAAAQLLPFFDLLKLSQRSAAFAGSDWPMPIWGWANFLIPLFGTFPSYHGVPAQPGQYWISTYYIPLGAVALSLPALARGWRPRLLAALSLFGAVLALGESGLVYKLLRDAVPAVGLMRFPIKFVVLPAFLLPWLAAWGLGTLRADPKKFRLLLIAACAIPAASAVLLAFQPQSPSAQSADAILNNAFGRAIFLALFVAALRPFLLGNLRGRAPALWVGIIILALWADSRFHAPRQNPTAPKWVFDRDLVITTNRPALGHSRLMISPEAALKLDHLMLPTPQDDISTSRLAFFCNANLIEPVPKLDGFFSLYLREPAQFIDLIYANTNRTFPSLEKLFCISRRTAPDKITAWIDAGLHPWIQGGQQPVFATRAETLQGVLDPGFNPSQTVFLPPEAKSSGALANQVNVEKIHWHPSLIRFEARSSGPAWVVLSQAYHPNWRATINGQPTTIHRANHAFQALALPASDSQVELKYIDRQFQAGLALSFLGLAAAALLVCWKKPRLGSRPFDSKTSSPSTSGIPRQTNDSKADTVRP